MASLVYDLNLTAFDHRPAAPSATYAYSEPAELEEPGGHSLFAQLTVTLGEDNLVSEFGLVPESIHVVVKVTGDVPADAWLEKTA